MSLTVNPAEHLKMCTCCGLEKDVTQDTFPRSKRSRSGWDSWCRQCRREYEQNRRQMHTEEIRRKDRIRYAKNGAERRRRARQKNPYGSKLVKLKHEYGADNMPYIELLLHDPCSYCGDHGPVMGIDHIVPRSEGGSNDWTNLTSCCRQCNGRKHAKPLLTALMERNGYRERVIGWAEKA